MNKLGLTFAALALTAVPALVSAQTKTATVLASATVQAAITATVTNDLNFGTLNMGVTGDQYSSTAGTSTQGSLGTATTAGIGQIRINHNSNVGVSASVPSVLTNTASSKTLAFAANCATATTSGGTGTSVGNCGTAFDLGAPATAGTAEDTYVLVGGTVTGDSNAGVGDFIGSVVFTFTAKN